MTFFMVKTPMIVYYASYYYAIKLKRNKKRTQNAMNFYINEVLYIFYPYLEILKRVLFEF
ncbi:hypothetical protein BB451_03050 [Helicobacter pylori]|uniref:Uncharacterized protein n=1 Tax=Helicobacter pylori TaxID=210 RepID=A0AB73QIM3_HELPX|nr:hypothetical protein BB451_03050 [Helicobacter pylori]